MDFREELQNDFNMLNKKLVTYKLLLKTIQGEGKPPCFKPVVDPDQLQIIIWNLEAAVKSLQLALIRGD